MGESDAGSGHARVVGRMKLWCKGVEVGVKVSPLGIPNSAASTCKAGKAGQSDAARTNDLNPDP